VGLQRGLLTVDPLRFELPRGQLAGRVRLNGRQATPVTDVDLRLTNARLEQFIPVGGGTQPAVEGALMARVRLTGAGNSVHRAAANANGELTVVAPSGEIREAFAQLLGVNVIKGLGLLLSKDEDQTPIRCAVAHFKATDGVLRADTIVVDTKPVLVTGEGTINLDSETLALKLKGHPKKAQLIRLKAPVTLDGPIRQPKLGIKTGGAVAQGGLGLALGSLLSPLAALLPFVDPGLAKDANCQALIAGAPVRTAAR
jgi:AsmA family protein